jgi:hypothetical protein
VVNTFEEILEAINASADAIREETGEEKKNAEKAKSKAEEKLKKD